jgi:phosphopantetheine--protein transferase-like protein
MLQLESCPVGAEGGHAAGRALLRAAWEAVAGGAVPEIAVTERGKPYFPESSLHFSITHTKKHAFCALSDRPIGIDAEELDRDISLALARKILSAGEYAQYEKAADKRLALLTFWVLKEALAKCTGKGLAGYPNHTDFSLEDPRVTVHDGCLLAVIEEDNHAV